MRKNNFLLCLIFTLLFTFFIKADVAPAPDRVRVATNLIVNTKEDLSDYKFFLTFPGLIKEVEIKNNAETNLPSGGGGARFSSGTLLAIPKQSLKEFGDKLTPETESKLLQAIEENKVMGVIELVTHRFSQDILISEKDSFSYPTYNLQRDGKTLKLSENQKITPKIDSTEIKKSNTSNEVGFNIYGISRSLSILFYILIGGIVILSLAFIIFAIRRSKKNQQNSIK